MSVRTHTANVCTHPQWCDRIGREYLFMSDSDAPNVQAAYRDMARRNEQLYRQIPVPVVYQHTDPYDGYQDMAECVKHEQQLRVYQGGSTPKYLSRDENLKGRAVHDWHGHLTLDVDFSPEGEFHKWLHMTDKYPDSVTQILFAEVVGQVAVIHHSGWNDLQQHCIAAPTEWIQSVCDYYGVAVPEGSDYHET